MTYDTAQIKQLAISLAPRYSLIQVALSQPVEMWSEQLKQLVMRLSRGTSNDNSAVVGNVPVADGRVDTGVSDRHTSCVSRAVDYSDQRFTITFPYDTGENAWLQELVPGVRFLKSKQHWWISSSLINAEALHKYAGRRDMPMTQAAMQQIEFLLNQAKELFAASHANDGAQHGYQLGEYLTRSYQTYGIDYAVKVERALIADEPGVGKTLQGAGVLSLTNSFPALIVCPKSGKYQWQDELKKALPGKQTLVCNSKSHLQMGLLWQTFDVFIINYDILAEGWIEENGKVTGVSLSDVARHILDRGIKAIVADESHYIKNPNAQRSAATYLIAADCRYRVALTGTPMDSRSVELLGTLYFLDRVKDFGGVTKFKKRFCGLKEKTFRGKSAWTATESINTEELGQICRSSFMIRRKKVDVLKDLPELQRNIIRVDIDNRKEYAEAEYDIVKYIRSIALMDENFRNSLPTTMTPEERSFAIHQYAHSKERAAERAKALVRLNALRQLAAKGKLSQAIEWVQNFRQSDNKLVVFAFNKDIQQALLDKLPGAERIFAEDSAEKRNDAVKRFSSPEGAGEIVCSLMAASEVLNLQAASDIFSLQLPYTPGRDDQMVSRCWRSGQKNAVCANYMIGYETIDIDTWELIEQKRKIVGEVLDGEQSESEFIDALMDKLLARYNGR